MAFVFADLAGLLDGNAFPHPVLLSLSFHRRHHHGVFVRNFFPVRFSDGSSSGLRLTGWNVDVVLDLDVLPVLLCHFMSDVFRLRFALVVSHFATDFVLLLNPLVDSDFTLRSFLLVLSASHCSLFGSPFGNEYRSFDFFPFDSRLTGWLSLTCNLGAGGACRRCLTAIASLALSTRGSEHGQCHK